MLGGLATYYFYGVFGLSYFVTLLLGAVGIGLVGMAVERLLFAPVRGKLLSAFIVSLGLLWVLQALAVSAFGVLDKNVPSPFPGIVRGFGIVVSRERVAVLLASAVLIAALYAFLRWSRHGIALRAVAQDIDAAALQGVNVELVSSLGFGIGCALAAVAGILLGPLYVISPFMGGLPVIKAFIIIILGGLGSVAGAVLGGLCLGLFESLGPLIMPIATVEILSFVGVMLVLVVRPRGLLGKV
jgi:branched-chain amino acid transport system permease protein